MKLKKGKGLFTSICTIITLMLALIFAGFLITVASIPGLATKGENEGWIIILIFAIFSIWATIYLYWHGIKILFGVDRNTWLFVVISFFAMFLGGILMLIAKVFD